MQTVDTLKRAGAVLGLTVPLLLASSALGQVYDFTASLSGAAEEPANGSPGSGVAEVVFDTSAQTMHVLVIFADLLGTTTASHIHAPTALPDTGIAGVATMVPTFADFPLGVTSGTYDRTFDLTDASTFNPSFLAANGATPAGAASALLTALLDDKAYLNIHSTFQRGGEIRGFLHQRVPDAAGTFPLLAAGLSLLAVTRRLVQGGR